VRRALPAVGSPRRRSGLTRTPPNKHDPPARGYTLGGGQKAAHVLSGMCSPLSSDHTRSKLLSSNGCCSASATWGARRAGRGAGQPQVSGGETTAGGSKLTGSAGRAPPAKRRPANPPAHQPLVLQLCPPHHYNQLCPPPPPTWNEHLSPRPALSLIALARAACTGLSVIPRAVQPYLRDMWRLLPPMPQPTSTI
jgi:hypothetical protein